MDARELRIGNFIQRRDLGNETIRWETVLELRKNKIHTSGPIMVINDYSDVEPIPITEEWLLKFGFEKQIDYQQREEEWGILSKSNQRMALGIYNHTGEKYLDYWCATFREDVGCGWSDLNDIEYVHQLQNLYFALTGEELSINKN
jgi:hypothetical protein